MDHLELRLTASQFDAMTSALGARLPDEGAAFTLCGTLKGPSGTVLTLHDVSPVEPGGFNDQGRWHLELRPDRIVQAVNWAVRKKLMLMEAHSHPFTAGVATFSPTDQRGMDDIAPFMLSSLPTRSYGATVWGAAGLEGRVWLSPEGEPLPIERVRIVGSPLREFGTTVPLRASSDLPVPTEEMKNDRLVAALGEEGRQKMSSLTVAIVGLGGLGSWLVESLLSVGIRSFILIDADRVKIHNLERQPHSLPRHVKAGRLKVEVSEEYIRSRYPSAAVVTVPESLFTCGAFEALKKADFMIGAVDTDSARLAMMSFSAAYLVPFVDCGTQVFVKLGRIEEAGGRVTVCLPGQGCLLCAGAIDLQQANFELSSSEAQERARAQGYVQGEELKEPMVGTLNGTIATIAATEVLGIVAGFKNLPSGDIHYSALESKVRHLVYERRSDCTVCSGLLGLADQSGVVQRFSA